MCYNVAQLTIPRGMGVLPMTTTTVTIRLDDEEKQYIADYAKTFGMTVSECVRSTVLERSEDELDLKLWEEAKGEGVGVVFRLGIHGLVVFINSVVIKTVHVFAANEVGLFPVGIAVGDGVCVANEVVLEIIKRNLHVVCPTKRHHGLFAPFAIWLDLKAFYVVNKDTVLLCFERREMQSGKEEYCYKLFHFAYF